MYRTVLCPLDGSPLAERALLPAVRLARVSGANLMLLTVVPLPDDGEPVATHEHDRARRQGEQYLESVVSRLETPDRGVVTLVRDGDAGQTIVTEAAGQHADLIIMGTHGRSGLGRWIYGSVADHILRHAAAPVLLVPPIAHPWPAGRPLRILVALDGSALAEQAVGPAGDLAGAFGAELVLVSVVALPGYAAGPLGAAYTAAAYDPSADLADAKRYLGGVAATLRGWGHRVVVDARLGGPSLEIVSAAREQRADVIAIATHGRSGLARVVLGSIATEILRRADVPVLLVGPAVLHGLAETARIDSAPAVGNP